MPQAPNHQRNSVRIVAGEYRSRKLEFPNLDGLRPTADRIRETLFNWLQNSIQAEICLDLFAGSGALGFEALSRGASRVDFVEKNAAAADAIRRNIERLDASEGFVSCADALSWLERQAQNPTRYGLVFLDPPFQDNLLERTIAEIQRANILRDGAAVYIERDARSDKIPVPENWTEKRSKKAGSVSYALYEVL